MARLDAEAANSDVEELIWSSNMRSSAGSELSLIARRSACV